MRRWLVVVLVCVNLLCAPLAWAQVQRSELVLGRISDDPKRHYAQLKPLLDYVVLRLGTLGIRSGRILMARDARQMASYLRRGRVDWVTETAGAGISLAERTGGRILLGTERNGVALYRTVLFARRDSGIRGLADLRGRSLALQSPSSTSAYFAPAAAILDGGFSLEILLSPHDRPRVDAIGYLFAGSESNIATWVHKGLVDAGAFSNIDWNDLERLPISFRDDLTVIHETAAFPRALEVVRGDIPAELETALRGVLLDAAEDTAAREPMLRFFGTTRFLPIDAGFDAALRVLAKDVGKVRRALE